MISESSYESASEWILSHLGPIKCTLARLQNSTSDFADAASDFQAIIFVATLTDSGGGGEEEEEDDNDEEKEEHEDGDDNDEDEDDDDEHEGQSRMSAGVRAL